MCSHTMKGGGGVRLNGVGKREDRKRERGNEEKDVHVSQFSAKMGNFSLKKYGSRLLLVLVVASSIQLIINIYN